MLLFGSVLDDCGFECARCDIKNNLKMKHKMRQRENRHEHCGLSTALVDRIKKINIHTYFRQKQKGQSHTAIFLRLLVLQMFDIKPSQKATWLSCYRSAHPLLKEAGSLYGKWLLCHQHIIKCNNRKGVKAEAVKKKKKRGRG